MVKTKKTNKSKWLSIPAYRSWARMKQRCLNKNHEHYHYYGGRGITICNEWLCFANFYNDMGDRPNGMTLERMNNNGNYERENCKWATLKEQALNRNSNIILHYNNQSLTLSEWSKKTGIKKSTLQYRSIKNQSIEDILNPNLYHKHKTITYRGICLTIKQWAKRVDIKRMTLKSRLNYGWSIERSLATL